ncbi:MAG: radical SAM protein [Nitrososphaerota archaeon]
MDIYKKIFNDKNFEENLILSREISLKNFGNKISFFAPSFIKYENIYFSSKQNFFPSISITGKYCALKCKHCNGKLLNSMYPALAPKELIDICRVLKNKGAKGFLISGGCMPNGMVPLENFIDSIALIKKELGLTIVIHTGLINENIAEKISKAEIDAVLIDIIGSNETIKEIYNLNATIEDFEKSLKILKNKNIRFVPHILVGLHYGKIKGELKALEIISKYSPSALIIIVFTPIPGTKMENIPPPKPKEIAKIIIASRFIMPNIPIVLGCMRPKEEHRIKTDILSIKAGINAIAFPTKEAIEYSKELKYNISFSNFCCSQIFY